MREGDGATFWHVGFSHSVPHVTVMPVVSRKVWIKMMSGPDTMNQRMLGTLPSKPTIYGHYAKGKLVGYALGTFIFGFIAVYFVTSSSWKLRTYGWCLSFLFVCVLLDILRRLFVSKPVLIISEEGIEHRRWGTGIIPWSEISALERKNVRSGRWTHEVVVVHLKNERTYTISCDDLDLELTDVLGHVRSFRPDLRFNFSC